MPREYVQLHVGALDSDRVAGLNDFAHRVWINSLIACDFAGRLDARPERLRSALFPLGTDRRTADIAAAVESLVKVGLALRYEVDGKPFLQLTRQRACGNAQSADHPWMDGSFGITYVELPAKGGPTRFVASSMPSPADGVAMGSAWGRDGVAMGSDPMPYTKSKTKRETNNESKKEKNSCPEPQAASGPPATLIRFPVKANHGNPWDFTEEHCQRLQDAFPGIDIVAEARKSLSWLEAHSDRRKTATGMPTFLHSWMTRSNDSGKAAFLSDEPDIFARATAEVSEDEARRLLGGAA